MLPVSTVYLDEKAAAISRAIRRLDRLGDDSDLRVKTMGDDARQARLDRIGLELMTIRRLALSIQREAQDGLEILERQQAGVTQ